MAEKIEKILVDITGLSRYHANLKTEVLSKKQDVISDLEDIRSKANAAAGAAADAAAQALTDAKAYADGLVMVDGVDKFDAAGAAADALDAAKAYADSLATNYDAAGAAATAEQNAKAYADSLADNYDAAGTAATAAAQALADAKADAASLYQVKGDYETAGAAADALDAAKTYVDGKVDGKFDAAGAAADAETAAKAYADSLATNYDAAGTAAGLNTAMDARVKVLEAIDHVQLAADAASSAVATVLDGAPEKFDTLKEVAQWIADSESAATAADLVTRVGALEAIDHDAYKAADETVLASAKTYADDLVMVDGVAKFDAAGTAAAAAAQALADAKADAASLYQVKGDYATVGQVNAKQDAITDLQTIRDGAALGATALQEVPAEYVTETELTGKGYLTADDFGFATDGDIDALFEIQ